MNLRRSTWLTAGMALLAACSGPASSPPPTVTGPQGFAFTPAQPKIGQAFTIKLQRVAAPQPETALPDGEFKVSLGKPAEEPPLWTSLYPFNWPRPIETPRKVLPTVQIGVIKVVGGAGEGTFELQPAYPAGIRPETGKPLTLQIDGPQWSMGSGFFVGQP